MDDILMIGLNHKVAPLEIREQLAISAERIPPFLHTLISPNPAGGSPIASEAVLLSTCNRMEIYMLSEAASAAEDKLRALLAERASSKSPNRKNREGKTNLEDLLYAYRGKEAAHHLMRVACGLDSLVRGENEILGQVRRASELAQAANASGPILSALFRYAIQAGKKARTECDLGHAALSDATLVVELALENLGSLSNRTALLIGAGKMSTLTARELVKAGLRCVLVANRTFKRASKLAAILGEDRARAVHFDALEENLLKADIVICSTGAPHIVLHDGVVRMAMQARPNCPLLAIDLAVPRDIDPAIAGIQGVSLVNIDDLETLVQERHPMAASVLAAAEAIVCQEMHSFQEWNDARRYAPLIRALNSKAESICQEQLNYTLHRLGEITPEQQQAVEAMGKAIIKKLLRDPILCIKDPPESISQTETARLVEALFGIY